jgi:molecular chaperone Hsp33
MTDQLLRGVFAESQIRFAYCDGAALCTEAATRHQSDRISGWLLSEALVCATLLSTTLKDDEKLTLRWIYPGPVGVITADMTERAEVRGFTQRVTLYPQVTTREEAIGGSGRISVVTSTRTERLRTGITEAIFRHVPRDLAYFLSLSFQIETALAVALHTVEESPVRFDSAAGLMLQPLPGCDPMRFEAARQSVERPEFQAWLDAGPRAPDEVLAWVEVEGKPTVYERTEPSYVCACSRFKAENVLRMLDPAELTDMLEKDRMAEINCHFCANSYVFTADELGRMLRQSQAGNA